MHRLINMLLTIKPLSKLLKGFIVGSIHYQQIFICGDAEYGG